MAGNSRISVSQHGDTSGMKEKTVLILFLLNIICCTGFCFPFFTTGAIPWTEQDLYFMIVSVSLTLMCFAFGMIRLKTVIPVLVSLAILVPIWIFLMRPVYRTSM